MGFKETFFEIFIFEFFKEECVCVFGKQYLVS